MQDANIVVVDHHEHPIFQIVERRRPGIQIHDRQCAIVGAVAGSRHVPGNRDAHMIILPEVSFPARLAGLVAGDGDVV